jgi:hypothetical protein
MRLAPIAFSRTDLLLIVVEQLHVRWAFTLLEHLPQLLRLPAGLLSVFGAKLDEQPTPTIRQ